MSVEFDVVPDQETLAAGLAEIRRRRRLKWTVLLVGLLLWIVASPLLIWLTGSQNAPLVPGILYVAAFVLATQYDAQSLCPRCGKEFSRRGLIGWPDTQHCLHCDQALRP
jgi:hypothetical protein